MENEFLFEMDELMNEGKFYEVIERISELDEDDFNTELHLMLAHALSQCAQYHEAINTLKDIDEDTACDDIGYHLEMAGALFGLHHYRAAVKEAKTCIDIDETCVEPWLLLCLVYQETGNDSQFDYASEKAKELDEDAWNNIFGDRSDELEIYQPEETQIVIEFIGKHFGTPVCIFNGEADQENEKQAYPINCVLIRPDIDNNFYKIVSIGIGAYSGYDNSNTMPDHQVSHRIEIAAFLPAEYSLDEIKKNFAWIPKVIRQFGEMLQFENSWLAAGHSISYGNSMDDHVSYNGVIFNDIFMESPYREKCILPCGEEVEFLGLIPLYEEEMMYKIEHGYPDLLNRMMSKIHERFDIITLNRPNTCLNDTGKKWSVPRSSLENLLEWTGGDGCYATDRITVDGCRVGFMYRELPEHDTLDSGWRFLAGDEDEDYMNDINNMDIFKLNTICNYDPDIIEYLESPVGSAYYRDKKGVFRRAN